jgi:hypothetical protein
MNMVPNLTKNGPEPECGHETAMFSGRTIDILGLVQLLVEVGDVLYDVCLLGLA